MIFPQSLPVSSLTAACHGEIRDFLQTLDKMCQFAIFYLISIKIIKIGELVSIAFLKTHS